MTAPRVVAEEVRLLAEAAIWRRLEGSGGWQHGCVRHVQTEPDGSVSIWLNSGGNALATAGALYRYRVSWGRDADGSGFLNVR